MRASTRLTSALHHRVALGILLAFLLEPLTVDTGKAQEPVKPVTTNTAGLQELLEHHAAWLGGPGALARLQDLTWSGTVKAAGLDGTLVLEETRSGWRRGQLRLGPLSSEDIVGPEGSWALNFSGQVEPMSSAKRETERQENLRSFGRHVLEPAQVRVRDLGREDRDGRGWQVASFNFPNGDGFDLFLDPADGSCTWIREKQDTQTFWTRLADWRIVSGVRLPFEQQTFHEDPKLDTTIRWSEVNINQGLLASAFGAPPSRASTVRIAGDARSTPWMEMTLADGRYMFVKGKVQGHETDILLDSGAQITTVSTTFAAELGLAAAGGLSLQGAVSTQETAVASGIDIEIGPLRLSDITVAIADLATAEQALGRRLPVVLGKELFNAVVVDIDYGSSRIAFHNPSTYSPEATAQPLRLLAAEGGLKQIEISVEGLPPASFALDTGSSGTVTLFKAYTEEHGLLKDRVPRSTRLTRGAGGGSVATVATLKTLTFAGFELRDVPAEFYDQDLGAFNTRRHAGNLGAGVLSRFRVALDYRGGQMYLVPRPDWDRIPFCKNRAGIQADYRGPFLEVVFVAPGSPASRATWNIGERIIAIDRKPIGPDYLGTGTQWVCGNAGSTVTLTDALGRHRKLVLADYY